MTRRLLLALAIVLTLACSAWAQPGPAVGTYDMEWAILHTPRSSDLPDLTTGTVTIQIESPATLCPPTSAFQVRNAPAAAVEGGSGTWCLKSDGSLDGSAGTNVNGTGGLFQYTNDIFWFDGLNRNGNDRTIAVGRRQTPPPPSTLQVFITSPHNGDTVSGTNWVVLWVSGTSGSSNVYTISVDGKQVGTQTTSSTGPVTIPWATGAFPNGAHTLTGSVRDATGATGSTSISVTISN